MMPIKQDFGINWRYGDEKSKGHCMLLSTNQARTSQTTPLYSPKMGRETQKGVQHCS
jgi:hypothetical protein